MSNLCVLVIKVSFFIQDTWKISVNFVVENLLDDELHIKHLANVVKIPQRKLFSYVKKEELMALVKYNIRLTIILYICIK